MVLERKPESPSPNRPDNDAVSSFLTGTIADIDRNITSLQNSLSLYPRSHSEHINSIYNLVEERWERFELSQDKEDLDKSILHCTEAIFLPPVSRDGCRLSNIFQLLFLLARAFLVFKQPEDIQYTIEYLRHLRELPPDSFDVPRNDVTISLIEALAIQVMLDVGDGTRNIKEMVVLCHELLTRLTSNTSGDFPIGTFMSLNLAVVAEYNRRRPIQLLDEVIDCLRDALKVCSPRSNVVLYALASQLGISFMKTHSNHDYQEAMMLLETILDHNQPRESPDSIRDQASLLSASLAFARASVFKSPEYSEVAISRLRTELSSPLMDERLRFHVTESLAHQSRLRFTQYSLVESLEEANSYTSQAVALSSSSILEKSGDFLFESEAVRETYSAAAMQQKIQDLEDLLSITPPGTERQKECLGILADWCESKFCRTNDIADIEKAVKYNRLSLDATHFNDPQRHIPLESLRNVLYLAFKKTKKISYLDESITLSYDIFDLGSSQHFRFYVIRTLVRSLRTREELLGRREDLHDAIRLISMVIDDQYAREPDRFRLSCQWAILARNIGHAPTSTAYKSAFLLMQRPLSFAPTVSAQHARLVAMGEDCQTMPLDYASFQIQLGRFEEAIEILEKGRALLWSEMRDLRTPMAQHIEEDSPLSKRFTEINQELEALTISVTPSGRPDTEDDVAQGGDGMDPFGRLVVKRRKLAEERDALISQIRGQPELKGILSSPSFATLRSAASRGPVIIVNHCEWRSDILIIFHNSLPFSIPTASNFYTRANKLRDELAQARKHGLDSREYKDALCSVLKGLYELVGEPVIRRLRALRVPEQSRI